MMVYLLCVKENRRLVNDIFYESSSIGLHYFTYPAEF